jgi:hypothetical protein
MLAPLSKIGRVRILEIAVPLRLTNHAYSAVDGVVSGFAASLGVRYDHSAFDLYAKGPLPHSAILAIHSEGEGNFVNMARQYPMRFGAIKPPHYKFD